MSASQLSDLSRSVDFPITICVLCYGQNAPLAERFLSSLYSNTDSSLFCLRAGLNEVGSATMTLFETYSRKFGNIDVYTENKNIFKNPLMRRLFHEKAIASRWTVWCDDDTHFIRPDWLQRLSLKIDAYPQTAVWGHLHLVRRSDESILKWIHEASWYCGLPPLKSVDENGHLTFEFRFAVGGFWVVKTEVINSLDWPDPRLIQAADDYLMGEALRQNGCQIGNFRYGVIINDSPRRNGSAPEIQNLMFGES